MRKTTPKFWKPPVPFYPFQPQDNDDFFAPSSSFSFSSSSLSSSSSSLSSSSSSLSSSSSSLFFSSSFSPLSTSSNSSSTSPLSSTRPLLLPPKFFSTTKSSTKSYSSSSPTNPIFFHPSSKLSSFSMDYHENSHFSSFSVFSTPEPTKPMYKSPVPFWGTILIAVGGIFFLLLCFICCIFCFCRGRGSKKKFKSKLRMQYNLHDYVTDNLVQPNLKNSSDQDYGNLHYVLDYKVTKSELQATVLKITDMPGSFFNKPSNMFVKVRLSPEIKTFQTRVVSFTSNPEFNESFIFRMPPEKQENSSILFSVFEYRLFSKNIKLSQLRVPLNQIVFSQPVENFAPLQAPEFTPEDADLGEVCLSLRYIPSQSKLIVVVIEIKDLCDMGPTYRHPYVKLYLFEKNRKVKKKKTFVLETTSKNPYFNESLEFKVDNNLINESFLKVKVAYRIPTVGGKSFTVGEFKVGSDGEESSGSKQWREIVSKPGYPFPMWHLLTNSVQ